MKKLFRFYWDCGRMGDLDGIFSATQEEVDAAIGKEIHLGEVLGKHSDIEGELEATDIQVLTDDQDFIAKAEAIGVTKIGYNPLRYIRDEDED